MDDTWSTAATLYALITGSSPFVAADEETIRRKIRAGAFAPLSTFDVGDDDLQHIIEAALNPTLASRTSNLAAFRQALEGWHPDSKVRELPPMVDDQPDDDDDDARTVMRPVSAADAVRALIVQREQAAAAARASEPPPQAAKETTSSANESAAKAAPAAAKSHGLLEDDDENAKTSMISVPPLAYLNKGAPATVPAPPPANMKSTPPPGAQSTGFNMMKAPGGTAARAPVRGKATVVGGFTAKQLMEEHQAKQAPPVAAPAPGISRDAVIEDGDNEATVMREAPLEVLRQATASIPPAPDRKTPVDPTSAVVAAMTAASPKLIPAAETNPPAETSFASISLIDDVSERGAAVEPRETPVSPSKGLDVKAILAGTAPAAARAALAGQTPAPTAEAAPTPGLATSSLTAPSTPGMRAPSTPGVAAPPTPAMAAPAPIATPVPQAPLAKAPAAPPPVAAEPTEQPSAVKGLFIGIGLALVIIAAAAAVYFFVVKH